MNLDSVNPIQSAPLHSIPLHSVCSFFVCSSRHDVESVHTYPEHSCRWWVQALSTKYKGTVHMHSTLLSVHVTRHDYTSALYRGCTRLSFMKVFSIKPILSDCIIAMKVHPLSDIAMPPPFFLKAS